MSRGVLIGVAVAALAAALGPAALARADDLGATTVATGHDASYPQCGEALPARGDIAVVGVNAGTGTTTNPCLAAQLAWGDAPAPDGSPRLADVYVNTANPGHLGGWWPSSDLSREGLPVADPYGTCRGAEDEACAYVYGWSIAADDAWRRGVSRPSERTWWLDVETMNTWSWDRSGNLAVLEGMTDAFRSIGARVGVYSTERQWSLIVGRDASPDRLAGVPTWMAGAVSRTGAEANCAVPPLVPGGRVVMAQWVAGDQDHDVACEPGVSGTRPHLLGSLSVGSTVRIDRGSWGPAGVTLRTQWLLDGRPIEGADGTTYDVQATDAGRGLSVRITGTRPGAPPLELTSDAASVQPAPAVPPTALPSPTSTLPVPTTLFRHGPTAP